MNWWILTLLLLVYTAACVFLIFVILIQSGKGGGLSSLAGASQGLSEALGTTSSERTMNKLTSACAIIFLVLAILISLGGSSMAKKRSASPLGDMTTAPAAAPLSSQPVPGATPAGTPAAPTTPAASTAPGATPRGMPAAEVTTIPPGAATNTAATPIRITVTPASGAAVTPAATPRR